MYDPYPLQPTEGGVLAKMGHVALDLLRELALHDPDIAEKARQQGLDLEAE